MELKESVARQKEALLKTLSEAIKIRSVQEEAKPGMPFGEGPAKCLDYMLKVCEDMGFRTKNVDNYMGWAEIGEGDEMVAILGHLDVVPEGKGWDKDPYSGEIDDTNVYGRGAMDDKGPAIAALYGMKAIVDAGLPLKRRIRILFGTNEETGAADMDYYLEKGGEVPVCGFTPDAEYPLINGEKESSMPTIRRISRRMARSSLSVSKAVRPTTSFLPCVKRNLPRPAKKPKRLSPVLTGKTE